MTKIDFITPFYNKIHNPNSLIDDLDSLSNSQNIIISAIPFYCVQPPTELFQNNNGIKKRLSLINSNEYIQLFELKYYFPEKGEKKEVSGRFFIYQLPEFKKVYLSLTIESSNFFRKALLPLIKSYYPQIIMTFIKHKKLFELLNNFKLENNLTDIIINRASYRLRFEDYKIVSGINWPDMKLEEVFDWADQNNGWFNSIQFKAIKPFNLLSNILFSRQGIIRTNHNFSKVFKSFIIPVCKIIYENVQKFSNRSRRDNPECYTKPLAIDFGIEQFNDKSENEKFIQAMKKYKKASISVLHGNPYIQMSIIDYLDGSTFDLWVVNTSELVIVPQMKGSIQAIKRIVNHIFDTYAEGKIKDYKKVDN